MKQNPGSVWVLSKVSPKIQLFQALLWSTLPLLYMKIKIHFFSNKLFCCLFTFILNVQKENIYKATMQRTTQMIGFPISIPFFFLCCFWEWPMHSIPMVAHRCFGFCLFFHARLSLCVGSLKEEQGSEMGSTVSPPRTWRADSAEFNQGMMCLLCHSAVPWQMDLAEFRGKVSPVAMTSQRCWYPV